MYSLFTNSKKSFDSCHTERRLIRVDADGCVINPVFPEKCVFLCIHKDTSYIFPLTYYEAKKSQTGPN